MKLSVSRAALTGLLFVFALGVAGGVYGSGTVPGCVRRAVESAVCERNGFAPEQVEIVIQNIRLPADWGDDGRIGVRIPPNDDAIGPVTVRASFATSAGAVTTVPIPIRVRRERIKRHQPVRSGSLERRREEITRLAPWVVTDLDSISGHWAARTVSAGVIVDTRWLAPIPLVRRGDRVTLLYETGAVRASVTAVVMEDGFRDQKIKVKGPAGRRLLNAVVVDEKTVRPAGPS
jgi:flagella basal body P-ring formation protein FlgA